MREREKKKRREENEKTNFYNRYDLTVIIRTLREIFILLIAIHEQGKKFKERRRGRWTYLLVVFVDDLVGDGLVRGDIFVGAVIDSDHFARVEVGGRRDPVVGDWWRGRWRGDVRIPSVVSRHRLVRLGHGLQLVLVLVLALVILFLLLFVLDPFDLTSRANRDPLILQTDDAACVSSFRIYNLKGGKVSVALEQE